MTTPNTTATSPYVAIKVDVDTERGTRVGVPNLLALFDTLSVPATFLFSLGPDRTGRAIKRIFRRGFLKKVARTQVLQTYGLRTLLNGTLLPAPFIGKRHAALLRRVHQAGHEVGIHCYDHIDWQDNLHRMTQEQVDAAVDAAREVFFEIFQQQAHTAGAAGWQANAYSLAAYDKSGFRYASDTRGQTPFFPCVAGRRYQTLQVPGNLPTLDEIIGRAAYPLETLSDYYLTRLQEPAPHVLTIHAEIEGMRYLSWFRAFLNTASKQHTFVTLATLAENALAHPERIPICNMVHAEIDGRSGTVAYQGDRVA